MIKEFAFFCSLAVADYSSSRIIINSGGKELNPLLKTNTKQILFHSGKCIAQSIITSKVRKEKRKKIYIITGIIGGGFVINNMIQMGKK